MTTIPSTDPSTEPKTDTKPDAVAVDKVTEAKPLQNTNTILAICVSMVILATGVLTLVVRGADTERRSIETAAKVEKMEGVSISTATDLATIKVKMGYMEEGVRGIAQDVKKIAEQRK